MQYVAKERFEAFLSASLIKAAELSLVEEAEATQSFLEKLISVRSYLLHSEASVPLSKEFAILKEYIRLLSVRFAGRFSADILELRAGDCLYVERGSIIQAFDQLFATLVENSEGIETCEFSFSIQEQSGSTFLILHAKLNDVQHTSEICLSRS